MLFPGKKGRNVEESSKVGTPIDLVKFSELGKRKKKKRKDLKLFVNQKIFVKLCQRARNSPSLVGL